MPARHTRSTAVEKTGPQISKANSPTANYVKAAGKKLAETKTKLTKINQNIRNAIVAGRIEACDQLELAQQAVESNLIIAEKQLTRLRESGDDDLERRSEGMNDSWEHLSRSIKNLVDRFSDHVR